MHIDTRKVANVIRSCQTAPQLSTAHRYAELYLKTLVGDPLLIEWVRQDFVDLINTRQKELHIEIDQEVDCEVFLVQRI